MNFFKELNSSTAFPICYNLLPHFAPAGQQHHGLMDCVRKTLEDGRIRTFFLTDRAASPQGFSSLQLADEILAAGGEPLVSLALTFDDRTTIIKKLREYCQIGVQQFLFVSGEYPAADGNDRPEPIFDLDSVQLLMLLEEMQEATDTAKGCAVSPFKSLESEQVWQYEKLKRKISVGANFVITQLGYDIRKFDELVQFCNAAEITAPLVANVFITDLAAAQLVQNEKINGVKVPGRLLTTLRNEETGTQGAREKRVARTAKLLTILKERGYHGALLGSTTAGFAEVQQVLDHAEELPADWQVFLEEMDYADDRFYYFQKDSQTGLNSSRPAPVAPKHFPNPLYSFSYFVDWLVYVPQGPLFKITGRFCHFCNGRKFWYSFIWLQEYLSKRLLYGCEMCGDCVLYACGFLCYRSGCPKKMVNGPCGGSQDGYCEVFPDKTCFWVRVYNNMKGVRQHITYVAPPIPARDARLDRSSSWINFFMGKDHRRMKQDGE